jgi:predicted Zn-dependent protease
LTAALLIGCEGGGGGINSGLGGALGDITGLGGRKEVKLAQAGLTAVEAASINDVDASAIGQSAALQLSSQYNLSEDPAISDYVNKVGLTVAAASPRPELVFTFGVLETETPNAFATPGGYVFVTRGALRLMEDESELAAVLAHEVAHIVKDHGLRAIQQKGLLNAAGQAVDATNRSAVVSALNQPVREVLEMTYSQDQERDADTQAVAYLKASGYDPAALARFLSRLDSGNKPRVAVMSSHPRTADRVANATKLAAGATGQRKSQRFKASVAGFLK